MRKTIVCFFSMLVASACFAADPVSKFTYGFALLQPVEPPLRRAAITRVNSEAREIARAILGDAVAEGLKIGVEWSEGNSNGFETRFECMKSLQAALGEERLGAFHNALGARYQALVADQPSTSNISVPTFRPLSQFISELRRKA